VADRKADTLGCGWCILGQSQPCWFSDGNGGEAEDSTVQTGSHFVITRRRSLCNRSGHVVAWRR